MPRKLPEHGGWTPPEDRPVFLRPHGLRDDEAEQLAKQLQHRLGTAAVRQTERMSKPTWWTVELDLPRDETAAVVRATLAEIDPDWQETLDAS